jgi:type I restriction enzyme, S subunit
MILARVIASLDRLIAKKRAIKQAMQQLLTGKTRLPGFKGKWETRRLGSLGTFAKSAGIRRDDVSTDGLPCIRYAEIYTEYTNYTRSLKSRITEAVASTSRPIHPGDLLFTASGETAEEIGKCVAYVGESQAYAGCDK